MRDVSEELVIPHRYRGPDTSGNGGWTCGAVASFVQGRAEVTLRRPPPLDTPMTVTVDGDRVSVHHGSDLVAAAAPSGSPLHVPPFVAPDEAQAASARYHGHVHHEFPGCFTCGTARKQGEGLRLFTGPVAGRPELVATTWVPDASLADDGRHVTPEVTWAALDCPSVWAHLDDGTAAVLGRLTARIDARPEVGRTYVVVGEATGGEGRKRFGSAALFSTDGELIAMSNAVWITIDR